MKKISLFLMLVIALTGCRSARESVSESHTELLSKVVADSSGVEKKSVTSEGMSQNVEKNVSDSVGVTINTEKSDSTVTRVDAQGNVLGTERWHKEKTTIRETRKRETELRDSVAMWRSLYEKEMTWKLRFDSLMQAKANEKKTVIVKESSLWEKFCDSYVLVSIFISMLAVIILIWWVKRKIPRLQR